MTKPRIIVTGATGKTGSVVITELLTAGYPVRALAPRYALNTCMTGNLPLKREATE